MKALGGMHAWTLTMTLFPDVNPTTLLAVGAMLTSRAAYRTMLKTLWAAPAIRSIKTLDRAIQPAVAATAFRVKVSLRIENFCAIQDTQDTEACGITNIVLYQWAQKNGSLTMINPPREAQYINQITIMINHHWNSLNDVILHVNCLDFYKKH